MKKEFEPQIIVFCCNWCSYGAADLAGSLRMSYPPNVKIIRVPCSGRVDPLLILTALELGIDGVLVTGCRKGECHYVDGNYRAEERVNFLKMLIENLELEPDRLEIHFMSASEPDVFAESAAAFTETIRKLGPNPLRGRLKKARKAGVDKKRKMLAEMARTVAKIRRIEPLNLGEIEAIEEFAEVYVDPDRCDGCGACGIVCDYNAIEFTQLDGRKMLEYKPEECVLCGVCIDSCPNKAMAIKNRLSLGSVVSGEAITQTTLQMRKCRLCGKYFIPDRLAESLMEKTKVTEALDYCPNCRVYLSAKKLIGVFEKKLKN